MVCISYAGGPVFQRCASFERRLHLNEFLEMLGVMMLVGLVHRLRDVWVTEQAWQKNLTWAVRYSVKVTVGGV